MFSIIPVTNASIRFSGTSSKWGTLFTITSIFHSFLFIPCLHCFFILTLNQWKAWVGKQHLFLTDKSPFLYPNRVSPAFPSVFLRLLVSENSAAVKEEKLLLKTYTPSAFSTEGFFFTRTQYFFLAAVCSLSPRPPLPFPWLLPPFPILFFPSKDSRI